MTRRGYRALTYFLDLFSGIGGFSLGAYWAGLRFNGHYFSEVDDYAIRVYQQRFPDAVPLGDIRSIRGSDLPNGDWIITFGSPCQDISVAGKGAGLEGSRSGLFFEAVRLVSELRPRFAIMENVGALVNRGLDRVLGEFTSLGYDAEWQDIRASDVGAPHRRERIWIVAYPCNDRQREPVQPVGLGRSCDEADAWGNGEVQPMANPHEIERDGIRRARDGRDQSTDGGEAIPDPEGERRGEGRPWRPLGDSQGQAEQSLQGISDTYREGLEKRNRSATERGPCTSAVIGDWWSTEPDVGRVAHGIPARVDRLKCLGNSIVPQIAQLIFEQSAFDEWRLA